MHASVAFVVGIALLASTACGGEGASLPVTPTANQAREIIDTQLAVDVTAKTATATITFGPSTTPGASLEVGDLAIATITSAGADMPYTVTEKQLDLGLPVSTQNIAVEITYAFVHHESFQGASKNGYTLVWPYYCGNVFPCHSEPADGTTFTLDVQGVTAGLTAVFPPEIPGEAPSYQIAWAIGDYTQVDLGTTAAGTLVSVWHLPNQGALAMQGTANLVAAFDWFEKTLGPYKFGSHVGSVAVAWPRGAFGGMEHHPRWHVGSAAIGDEETNVHEAAHGWFGDGIRIQCWEDFVLSEGTTSYLAARALDVVAPTVGAATWQGYATDLAALQPTDLVWPQSCGVVDVIEDNLFSRAPYMRGAFFYKAVADKVGADKVDEAIGTFYKAHGGGAATMQEMLDTIRQVTGYDATACAATWLKDATLPTPGPCP